MILEQDKNPVFKGAVGKVVHQQIHAHSGRHAKTVANLNVIAMPVSSNAFSIFTLILPYSRWVVKDFLPCSTRPFHQCRSHCLLWGKGPSGETRIILMRFI